MSDGGAVGGGGGEAGRAARPKRADARRNEETLLDAAAAIFVTSGVEAPVRDIAAKAGVGTGTIYRHFPTRADLIIAVYRHQVEACAEAGPALLASSPTPHAALGRWINLFVDFLVTKPSTRSSPPGCPAPRATVSRTSSTAGGPSPDSS
ncbi:TetR/AcrR family transcriptional regulator, partial [Streptomyces sp. NPDC005195]|uniref:TetR/AcrR family transcriptional regulator n=1 Tax=Streptomyces sp. NPDC005195 TaxID=3154561 RepID=UPI0033B1B2BA